MGGESWRWGLIAGGDEGFEDVDAERFVLGAFGVPLNAEVEAGGIGSADGFDDVVCGGDGLERAGVGDGLVVV